MSTSPTATKPKPGYEAVFTVSEYYDGPRGGLANFHGVPHIYECIFDEKSDKYSDSYFLMPVGPEILMAAMTNWRIFLKWRAAFDAGQTTLATHPALPEDKARYDETRRTLEQVIALAKPRAIRMRGEFGVLGEPTLPRDVHTRWQVRWIASTEAD
jgi:hypothetical protein